MGLGRFPVQPVGFSVTDQQSLTFEATVVALDGQRVLALQTMQPHYREVSKMESKYEQGLKIHSRSRTL